ncbi:MAG: PhoPQ-activated protein PqaA family protein [Gammaproteobacteria bacterium]
MNIQYDFMRNFILIAVLFSGTPALAQTALDRYIAKPEPDFSWQEYAVDHKLVADTYFIKLVSQRWRSAAEVDRSIWEHELIVIVPNFLLCNSDHRETALLMIAGGRNPDPGEFTTEIDATAGVIATSLCTVVAVIKQVPNQPLQFADEFKRPRREDAILAYSLNKYLETGDEEWPVHLAMTKAAVKAMDAVQAFSRTHGSVPNIDDFIVLGGSKRGWTTWLAAAVDARVKAVVPISIDLLNLDEQFQHHWEAYGFYTPSVRDYEEYDIACRMQTPRGQQLLGIIDPLSYRERYTMPKLIINSAGDQFFVSDSWRFYYDDLPEPKRLRYTPNTSHSQGDLEDVIGLFRSTIPWLKDVRANREAPRFDWRVEADGSIRVQTIDPPEHVRLWQAHNPTHRDFRLEAIGPAWHANDLQDRGGGVYVGFVAPPAQGFSAYFVELEFPNSSFPASNPLFTTGVVVTPDVLPFAGYGLHDFKATPSPVGPGLPSRLLPILQRGNQRASARPAIACPSARPAKMLG